MVNESEGSIRSAERSDRRTFDVCIVGGGAAGACAARLLRNDGARVALVDARPRCLPCFKVEKLTRPQIDFFSRFGLMASIAPHLSPIHRVETGRRGRFVATEWIEEYGFHYHELVNALRSGLKIVVGHVASIALSDTTQRVTLLDGSALQARLVVLASGGATSLHDHLGISRRKVHDDHSMSFGFMFRTASGKLPFDEVNVLPDRFRDRIDYLTLFPVPDGLRGNLFTYHDARSPIVRAMKDHPGEELERIFSRLHRLVGQFEIVSKVDAVPMNIWVATPQGRPGVVLIGDAFQSACPATGIGLTKVLNDVEVLRPLVQQWLATPGMPADKVDALYAQPQKCAVDARSLTRAEYRFRLNTDTSLRMRLHRGKEAVLEYWRRLRQRVGNPRGGPGVTAHGPRLACGGA